MRRVAALVWGLPPESALVEALRPDEPVAPVTHIDERPMVKASSLTSFLKR